MGYAAAAVAAFNLVCTGTSATTDISGSETKPYSTIYRVDLGKGGYCEHDCRVGRMIKSVQPTALTPEGKGDRNDTIGASAHDVIDRESGKLTIYSKLKVGGLTESLIMSKYVGQCEKRPFTRFPTFSTRF